MTPSAPAIRLLAGWAAAFGFLLLALPVGARVEAASVATRFLAEFLSEGRSPWLSAATPTPLAEPLALTGGGRATVWRPRGRHAHPGLVLVHGLTPEGKDDPRMAWAAGLLARGGFVVLAPELPEMRAQRLRPADAGVVAAALDALRAHPAVRGEAPTVVGISVGIQPALAGAIGRPVRRVVSLGGYAEARELVRYFTTGQYAYGAIGGRVAIDPALAGPFMSLNLDLVQDPTDREAVRAALAGQARPASVGPEARAVLALLENRDPARVDGLLADLPAGTRALLDALSPARSAPRLRARLLLVHGRGDPAIPFTESLRLAAAADPTRTRLVLVDLVAHVEGRVPVWRQAGDLARLWSVAYELFRVRP